jgi:Sulfotransferase family
MNDVITIEEFNMIKKIPMVFILGKERSGTTLLQNLLGNHPNVIGPPECDFILFLYPRFGKIKKWTEKDIHHFIEELFKEQWISKVWRIDKDKLTSILLSIKETVDYASICRVIYYCMRNNKENILLMSDKNPIYVLLIPTILKIFPDAKFIHLIREPRDNVNSHLKSFKVKNVRFQAQKWLAYSAILQRSKRKMPEKCYTLLYENLVEHPEVSMRRLCEFLLISYDDKMIQNPVAERLENSGIEPLLVESAKIIHANLLKPVNTTNIGKWKTGMSNENIEVVEKITGAFAAKNFNYLFEKGYGKISIATNTKILKTKIIYYCWQFFTRIKYKSYWFNTLYTNVNLYFGRETRVFGKGLNIK